MKSSARYAALVFALAAPTAVFLACQSDDSGQTSAVPPGGNNAGGSGQSAGGAAGTSAGGQAAGGASGSSAGGAAGGASDCGTATTITELNQFTGDLKSRPRAKLSGVVATSQKFLVSPSKTGCLWGVFVSMPGEAAEYGGIQVVTKGDPPTAVNGKTVCDPDKSGVIPNDIAPGDVLDVSGFLAEFLSNSCGETPDGGTAPNPKPAAGQRQLSDISCFNVTQKGGAPVTPHVISDAATLDAIAAGADADLLRKWGSALVTVSGSFTATQPNAKDYADATQAVSKFGDLVLNETKLTVNNGIFYNDLTCGGPKDNGKKYSYALTDTFTSLTGILAVNFCSWELSIRNRCGDIAPTSSVCSSECMSAGSGGAGGSGGGTPENTAELCADGQDNDNNGYVDCNDKGCCGVVDCSSQPTSYCGKKGAGGSGGSSGGSENTVELCSDKTDNDGDSYIDCNDSGCCGVVDCSAEPTSYCGKKGAGGSGGAGGSSSAACTAVNGSTGCCKDAMTVTYCNSSGAVQTKTCSAGTSCGYDATKKFYTCTATPGTPPADAPMACPGG